MPIYEFRCLKCGEVFELLNLKKEGGGIKMKCPKCKSPNLDKVLSRTSVIRSGGRKATQTVKSCSSGTCSTIEVPGRSK